ncbi:MAG: LysE/ArgO family amino acid transporter [Paracoccaceae bacterium]
MIGAALSGFQLMMGLILVIGPQNAFVLRQGLRREHVAAVVAFCALPDATLMGVGVAGMAGAQALFPWAETAMRWGGAAFLLWYAFRSFRSALTGSGALHPGESGRAKLSGVLAALAAVTWANPHVWLDTVVLFGSVASQYPGREVAFWAGASIASTLFFALLGFGARLLAPVFARPAAWRVLDGFVGAMMLAVAAQVVLG